MLQDSDLLQTIAEVAVAILGFTGVVAFLGQRAQGAWRTVDLFRLNQLLAAGIAALLFAFLPILLFKLGASESATWRISSGLMAVYFGGALFVSRSAIRNLPETEGSEIVPWILSLILMLNAAVLVLQVLCAAGVAYAGSSAPMLVGLVYLLAFASFQFVRLLQRLDIESEQ